MDYCDIEWFPLEIEKVGKTTRPFKYELNQIPYDYTVEVTNRLKCLDLIDRVPEELWMEVHDTIWDSDHSQEKEMQKGKMVACGGLTNSCEKKRSKRQRRKGEVHPSECRAPKNSKER